MAKKKTATRQKEAAKKKSVKRSAPSKQCPSCGSSVHARLSTCKLCGHVFVGKKKAVKKKAGRKKARRPAVAPASDLVIRAAELIQQSGGADAARQAIQQVEHIIKTTGAKV